MPYSPEGMTFQLCLSETPPSPSMTLSKSLALEPLWRALSSKSGYSSRFLSALTSVEYSGKSINSTRSLSTVNLPIFSLLLLFKQHNTTRETKTKEGKNASQKTLFCRNFREGHLLGTPAVFVGDPGNSCWRPRYASGGVKGGLRGCLFGLFARSTRRRGWPP